MLISILAVVVGLVLLVWSADKFVEGASAVALNLGVSTLVIGITIIGFGTSAPEILISLFFQFL
jgi:cation:H+ antiporter